jgi:1-phosphofructokinase family hexose kinase
VTATHRDLLIVGPNLTIDRTLGIEELVPGWVLRFESAAITPGGKGVNVARAASRLGCGATLVSFAPGHTGEAVARLVREEGIDLRAVPVGGEIRSSAIVRERGGRVTVMNEPGPRVRPEDWNRLLDVVREELVRHRTVVCSGSSPPGTPDDAYGRVVREAGQRSLPVLVDASGPLLEAALEAGADFVAPNLVEAEASLWGARPAGEVDTRGVEVRERAQTAALALVGRGARVGIVTAGAAGVAVAWEGGARWVEARAVRAVNPIGAGDTFVAAVMAAVGAGRGLGAAVAAGVGAAAAGVERPLAGDLDVARARRLRAELGDEDWGPASFV